jgi:hypothetical protein
VLVVGMGNTGAEIALDLAEHGVSVALSVRSPVNIVHRDVLGRPTQQTSIMLARLPTPIGDALARLLCDVTVGDIGRYGLPRSRVSPLRQLREQGRTPVIDVGTLARIKSGEIGVFPRDPPTRRRRRRVRRRAHGEVRRHRPRHRLSRRRGRAVPETHGAGRRQRPADAARREAASSPASSSSASTCARPAACSARSPSRRSRSLSGSALPGRVRALPDWRSVRARLASQSTGAASPRRHCDRIRHREQESQRPPLTPNEIAIYAVETKAIIQILWGLLLIMAITLVAVSIMYVLLRLKMRSNRRREAQLARSIAAKSEEIARLEARIANTSRWRRASRAQVGGPARRRDPHQEREAPATAEHRARRAEDGRRRAHGRAREAAQDRRARRRPVTPSAWTCRSVPVAASGRSARSTSRSRGSRRS